MTTPPTDDRWDEAFSQSHELDPTSDCWGLYAYSDAPPPVCGSGVGSFHWFHTEAELISFIRDYFAWWHPAPSSMEPEEIAAEVQAIVDAESDNLPTMVDRLNEFMGNMWHIEWCRQFRELSESTKCFPLKLRSLFWDATAPAVTTCQERMCEMFAKWLRTFGY